MFSSFVSLKESSILQHILMQFQAVLGRTLTARLPGIASGDRPRLHTCISQATYTKFPNDRYDNSEFDDLETSGGETDAATEIDASDSDEEMQVIEEITPPPSSQARPSFRHHVGLHSCSV